MSNLFPALLLAGLVPVSPSLDLQPTDAGGLAVRLCFQGDGQQVRFDLNLESRGQGGRARSRQSGGLTAAQERHCPVRLQVGAGNSEEIRARLRWWVDGVEQEPIERTLHRL
ncbi:hypothetical protein D9M68_254980 [compost metagenome]|uniref:Uncharacterized protein n=1 Tax=Pseudomonas jinjuensis TaxID=198616 RepID=A0A1H0LBJ7_9PSED|nr:hypothetical protein [Pseudomonas jinjuensis]SDO65577.1 hypothetical protein SAMN05216193_1146 [Pseudomonas jinjuensis]